MHLPRKEPSSALVDTPGAAYPKRNCPQWLLGKFLSASSNSLRRESGLALCFSLSELSMLLVALCDSTPGVEKSTHFSGRVFHFPVLVRPPYVLCSGMPSRFLPVASSE